MKRILLMSFLLLGMITSAWAQRTVSGTVTDAVSGGSLPGVAVRVKSTGQGVVTDMDGNYRVSVTSDQDVLIFSFVGYAQKEMVVGQRTNLNVSLEENIQELETVVVTGYQVQDKRSITGSVSNISGDVVQSMPVQTVDRAIQGRLSGVQVTAASGAPGGAVQVRVRGVGSITAGNDPLYIIDGVQVNSGLTGSFSSNNALSNLNPNDIESIDVLKDAAAAAIYGAQAANGVVIITTKRGKEGKTQVDFSAQYGYTDPIRKIPTLNTQQFKTLRTEALTNRFGPNYDPTNAGLSTAQYVNQLYPDTYTNWQDLVYRTGINKIYDVAVSGGDKKTRFYIAGSYNDQEGHIIASSFERATLRANIDHTINERFSIEQKISLSSTTTLGTIADGAFINSPHFSALFLDPFAPVYNEDGSYFEDLTGSFRFNPIQRAEQDERQTNNVQAIGNVAINYKIAEGLRWRSFAGIDFSDMSEHDYRNPDALVNRATGGALSIRDRRIVNWNTSHTLSYKKTLGDVHGLEALAGFEYRNLNWTTRSALGQGFPNSYLRTMAAAARPVSVGSFDTEWTLASVFGSINYNYDRRYIASATYRRDGSSRFGQESQYGNFYSGSLAWSLSEEAFLQNVSWLSALKLRASYGVTGNSDIAKLDGSHFPALSAWGTFGEYASGGGIARTDLGNSALTWEDARQTNLGVDYAFFKGRIAGSFNAFRTINDNLLLYKTLPQDVGYGVIYANVGKVQNEGLEFEITTRNVDAAFKWNTSFNVTFIRNEVLDLFDGNDFIIDAASGARIMKGESLGSNWYPTYAGVNPANGRPMWYDTLGNITYQVQARDYKVQGNTLPSSFGGLVNSFSYKGLSLEVFFQYQYGVNVLNNNAFFHENSGSSAWNQAESQMARWQKPGDMTGVPKPYEGGTEPNTTRGNEFSTRQIEDASYIRLKQVTLGYELPKTLINRIGMRNARVFAQGINLLTFTEYTGFDPEFVGIDLGRYPQGKTFTFGVNVGF